MPKQYSDVDEIWYNLKSMILSACDLYIPKVTLRSFQHPKWFTPALYQQMWRIVRFSEFVQTGEK